MCEFIDSSFVPVTERHLPVKRLPVPGRRIIDSRSNGDERAQNLPVPFNHLHRGGPDCHARCQIGFRLVALFPPRQAALDRHQIIVTSTFYVSHRRDKLDIYILQLCSDRVSLFSPLSLSFVEISHDSFLFHFESPSILFCCCEPTRVPNVFVMTRSKESQFV